MTRELFTETVPTERCEFYWVKWKPEGAEEVAYFTEHGDWHYAGVGCDDGTEPPALFGPRILEPDKFEQLERLLMDCGMILSTILVADEDKPIRQLKRMLIASATKRVSMVLDYFQTGTIPSPEELAAKETT